VAPASPLTFCGLSLNLAVSPPAWIGIGYQNGVFSGEQAATNTVFRLVEELDLIEESNVSNLYIRKFSSGFY